MNGPGSKWQAFPAGFFFSLGVLYVALVVALWFGVPRELGTWEWIGVAVVAPLPSLWLSVGVWAIVKARSEGGALMTIIFRAAELMDRFFDVPPPTTTCSQPPSGGPVVVEQGYEDGGNTSCTRWSDGSTSYDHYAQI